MFLHSRSWFCAAVALLSIGAMASHAEVRLWPESAGTMIMPDRAAPGEVVQTPGNIPLASSINVTALRNETIGKQLALRATTGDTIDQPLSLFASALTGPGGASIQAKQITLYRAADIEVDHAQKVNAEKDPQRARPLGKFPDALVPLVAADGTNVANAIKPAIDRTIALWVDIAIPETAKAGDYTGKVELKRGDAVIATVPVAIHVVDAAIPADASMPSIYNLRLHPHVLANLDAYVAEVFKHRLQPNNTHYLDYVDQPDKGFATLDKYNPGGRGWQSIYVYESKKLEGPKREQLMASLQKATDHLKSIGLLDRSFIYLHDEPDLTDIPGMVDVANDITTTIPDWKGKLLCTLNKEGTPLNEMLNHHVRALSHYGPWTRQPPMPGREEWDKRRAAGQQLWFYVSNAQGVPFPTFDVNTPNLAFEPRVLGWAWWYEKAYGHLYWDLMFRPAWALDKKFPPGDGELIYPGDFTLPGAPDWVLVKDLHGPVVSRRLKVFRQGLQEWELLKLAEKKAGREKVQAIVDKVYTTMGQRTWAPGAYNPAKPMWSYDESAWDNARSELIDLLVK